MAAFRAESGIANPTSLLAGQGISPKAWTGTPVIASGNSNIGPVSGIGGPSTTTSNAKLSPSLAVTCSALSSFKKNPIWPLIIKPSSSSLISKGIAETKDKALPT